MPIFNVSGKFVLFSHVPKTAGSSIEVFLKGVSENFGFINPHMHGISNDRFPCSPQHFHLDLMYKLFGDGFFNYEFAIVRNPLDRAISEYKYRFGDALRRGHPCPSAESWIIERLADRKKNPFFMDNHFRPQFEFVGDRTKVFRFEDGLKEAMGCVLRDLGVFDLYGNDLSQFPHRNKSVPIEVDVTEKLKAVISEEYAHDFSKFGY